MSSEFTRKVVMTLLKIFQSDWIQRSYPKKNHGSLGMQIWIWNWLQQWLQQKFQFEISEISCAQWNGTFRLHRPHLSHRTFGYGSCKQDTKERYWGRHNFVKWKGAFQSNQLKWLDRSEWTTLKAGPEYSSRTKPKWLVPFDVPTEISGFSGCMKSTHGFINGMLGGKHDLAWL